MHLSPDEMVVIRISVSFWEWWVTMYLTLVRMMVILISFAALSFVTIFLMWWFDRVLSIKRDDGLPCFSCCLKCEMYFYFSHWCRVPYFSHDSPNELFFVFVGFGKFLVMVPNFGMWYLVAFWWEFTMAMCDAIWAPMMKFMVTQFWTSLVWSMSLSVCKNFVVGHSWACRLIVSWPR